MAPRSRLGGRSTGTDPRGTPGISRATVAGVCFIVVALIVSGLAIWFYASARSALVELRAADLCPKDDTKPPPAVFVVLIDQTDPFGPVIQQAISNVVLGELKAELEQADGKSAIRHARVEVWTFSNAGPQTVDVGNVRVSATRVLSICNPGAPGEWERLYKNLDVVRRQHSRFYRQVNETISQSLGFPEASQSPVIEAIHVVGVQVFSRPEHAAARKRLWVVSDFLQNTPGLSMFQSAKPRYADYARTLQAQRAAPKLADVEVVGLVIRGARPDLQGREFWEFWQELMHAAGIAAPLRFTRVP